MKQLKVNYLFTLGIDYYCKEVNLDRLSKANGSITKKSVYYMEFWDACGSECESKLLLSTPVYKNANCFIICCSYDNLSSLSNIKIWLDYLSKYLNHNDTSKNPTPIFIIVNKYDIPPKLKKFGADTIKSQLKLFEDNGRSKIKVFYDVSAKDNLNVETVFDRIIKIILGFENNSFPFVNYEDTGLIKKNSISEINLSGDKNKKSFSLKPNEKSVRVDKGSKDKKKCC